MRIAFQGEPGAYSEAAALRFSGHADVIACESFDDVFRAVEAGRATHGILPVENSIGGSIHRNFDLLQQNPRMHGLDQKLVGANDNASTTAPCNLARFRVGKSERAFGKPVR